MIEGVPLGPTEVLGSRFLCFVTGGLLNLKRRFFLIFQGFCFHFRLEELKLTLFSYPNFGHRMARGQEEVSTN